MKCLTSWQGSRAVSSSEVGLESAFSPLDISSLQIGLGGGPSYKEHHPYHGQESALMSDVPLDCSIIALL